MKEDSINYRNKLEQSNTWKFATGVLAVVTNTAVFLLGNHELAFGMITFMALMQFKHQITSDRQYLKMCGLQDDTMKLLIESERNHIARLAP